MSKMGKYGALAGLGQGVMFNARARMEEETAARQAEIDEARERRLLEYKAQLDAEAREQIGGIESRHISERGVQTRITQDQGGHIESRHIGERGEQARETQADIILSTERESRENRTHSANEGRLDRESRERIASMSGDGSASAAAIEARERFERTTFTQTSTNEQGFPVEAQVPAIYDKQTRQYFIQEGTRYVPPGGGQISLPQDESGAVNHLLDNPQYAIHFIEKYGYLPSQFIQSLPSQRQ